MKLYLDTSVLNRPFDLQANERIIAETKATIEILEKIEAGKITLVHSTLLEIENGSNPNSDTKGRIFQILTSATEFQTLTEEVSIRSDKLTQSGVKLMDSLHVACAEISKCDYFLTVDYKLAKKQHLFRLPCLNPTELEF